MCLPRSFHDLLSLNTPPRSSLSRLRLSRKSSLSLLSVLPLLLLPLQQHFCPQQRCNSFTYFVLAAPVPARISIISNLILSFNVSAGRSFNNNNKPNQSFNVARYSPSPRLSLPPTPPPPPINLRLLLNYRYLVSFRNDDDDNNRNYKNNSRKHSRQATHPSSSSSLSTDELKQLKTTPNYKCLPHSINPPCTDDLTSRLCSAASAPGCVWTRPGIPYKRATLDQSPARTVGRRSWMWGRGQCSAQRRHSHGSPSTGRGASCSAGSRWIGRLMERCESTVWN